MTENVNSLAQTYARFFVEDFAGGVMQNLKGSYPLPDADIKAFIAEQSDTVAKSDAITLGNNGTINRFLMECAQYALEKGYTDPSAKSVYEEVSQLPSIHHSEIQTIGFTSSDIYRRSIETQLLGVIARDAHNAAKAITTAAQKRISLTETGGSISVFNWGLLADGLFLNAALIKANDMANIFRAGDTVVGYYAQTAFDFAQQNCVMPVLDDEAKIRLYGELNVVVAHAPSEEIDPLLNDLNLPDLQGVLFNIGTLSDKVRFWQEGVSNSAVLIQATAEMSILTTVLKQLRAAVALMEDGTLISETLLTRIDQAYNVCVLCLAGYEALRETKYADTLIIDITSESTDPRVTVFVNADMLPAYHAAGGEDIDLIRFGLYLDPRKGMPVLSSGYSMEFLWARRDDIIPSVIADDNDRLDRLRNNDEAIIQSTTLKVVNDVAESYLHASQHETLSFAQERSINELSRKVTAGGEVDLGSEITSILVSIIDDPFLTDVSQTLVGYMTNSDETTQQRAVPLTIAAAAVRDAHRYITTTDEE